MVKLLVACLTLAPIAALADDARPRLYWRTSLGGGYGHYVYPDGLSTQAGRNGGGPVVSVVSDLGVRWPSGFIFALTASFEPIVSMNSMSPRGTRYFDGVAFAGMAGPLVGLSLDRLTLTATLAAGAGGSSHAGGYGVYVAPNISYTFRALGDGGLQVYLRPVYGFLGSSPGISMYLGATAGLSLNLVPGEKRDARKPR